MSQARRTWEVAYRAVITSLQLLDDYRTVMGIENGSGRSHVIVPLCQLINSRCLRLYVFSRSYARHTRMCYVCIFVEKTKKISEEISDAYERERGKRKMTFEILITVKSYV